MADTFCLNRFEEAQTDVYEDVLSELRSGEKAGHWIWFVFPQMEGLGASDNALYYGITGLPEAQAYLAHPILGPRLLECTRLMLQTNGKSAQEVLGSPDDLKFRSCMTLFNASSPDRPEWDAALKKYFDGVGDEATLALLRDRR